MIFEIVLYMAIPLIALLAPFLDNVQIEKHRKYGCKYPNSICCPNSGFYEPTLEDIKNEKFCKIRMDKGEYLVLGNYFKIKK